MKNRIRAVLCMICMVIGMNLLLAGCFYYAVNCKKTLRDISVSPDERYELTHPYRDRGTSVALRACIRAANSE